MNFADDYVVDDPLTFYYFLEGDFAANILRFGSNSWCFCFTKCGVFELSRVYFTEFGVLEFSGIVRILFSCVLARIEFSVLVIKKRDLDRSCRACFRFIIFSRGSHAFSFLVDPVPFIFLFCLGYSNSLALDSCCEGLGVRCFVLFQFK